MWAPVEGGGAWGGAEGAACGEAGLRGETPFGRTRSVRVVSVCPTWADQLSCCQRDRRPRSCPVSHGCAVCLLPRDGAPLQGTSANRALCHVEDGSGDRETGAGPLPEPEPDRMVAFVREGIVGAEDSRPTSQESRWGLRCAGLVTAGSGRSRDPMVDRGITCTGFLLGLSKEGAGGGGLSMLSVGSGG